MHNPFFSIIIPTYNRAHLLVATLNSILNQTFTNYEVLIIDDGSTDGTQIFVSDYIHKHQLKTWSYYYKKNEERGAARNHGVLKARATYITFLDSDDHIYADHFEKAYRFILEEGMPEIIHQAYEFKNASNGSCRPVGYPRAKYLNAALLRGNCLSNFGLFLQRSIACKFMFKEDRAFSGSEDWLLWLKLAARYPIFFNAYVSGCLVEHEQRSVLHFNANQLLYRAQTLLQELKADLVFINKFSLKAAYRVYAHMLTYAALHLAFEKKRPLAIKLFLKGIIVAPSELFTRRTLAIIKHLF